MRTLQITIRDEKFNERTATIPVWDGDMKTILEKYLDERVKPLLVVLLGDLK